MIRPSTVLSRVFTTICVGFACGILAGGEKAQIATPQVQVRAVNSAGARILANPVNAPSNFAIDEDPADDTVRLVLLTSGGPVIVKMTLSIAGEPFRVPRERLVDAMLSAIDPENQGDVTWESAVSNPRFLFGRLNYAGQTPERLVALLKQFDLNDDTKVDRSEIRQAIVRSLGGAVFQAYPYAVGQQAGDLRPILDTNRDDFISPTELDKASENLKKHDVNDNDLFELTEALGQTQRRTGQQNRISLFSLGANADLVSLNSLLTNRYANADKKVARESFAFAPGLFRQLDLNQNGEIDSGETILFHIARPQIELDVQLDISSTPANGVRIIRADPELGNLDDLVKVSDNRLELNLPGLALSFQIYPDVALYENYAKQRADVLLRQYDLDKNGYIEKSELMKNSQNPAFLAQFERWDADNDGKVFVEELVKDNENQFLPQKTQVMVRYTDQGPSLFETLDVSNDRRLSVREMRLAKERLLLLDKDGDGQISLAEMPGQFHVAIGRANSLSQLYRQTPTTASQAPKGPDWFVRMDRNGDGDLTPREFLGTAEQFAAFDSNQDGLLEPAEAERANSQNP